MRNEEEQVVEGEAKSASSVPLPDWTYDVDEDIMKQQSEIQSSESEKIPFVGDMASAISLPP